jgi:hypothetical protein
MAKMLAKTVLQPIIGFSMLVYQEIGEGRIISSWRARRKKNVPTVTRVADATATGN